MPVERRVFSPLLWRASSLLGIARSIELSWFGCRSERTGATYHIRGESQEEISVMGAFTNLIQCGGVEGGDGVWVDSCSGPPHAARSRVGPSIKFRGFGEGAYTHVGAYIRVHNKITYWQRIVLTFSRGLVLYGQTGGQRAEGRQ